MSSLKDITGKKFEIELKHGATLEDFLEEYDCTREEFIAYLEKNFSEKARNSMLRYMNKNSKKPKQFSGKSSKSTSKGNIVIKHIEEKPTIKKEKTTNNCAENQIEPTLEELKEKERYISSEVHKQNEFCKELELTKKGFLDNLEETNKTLLETIKRILKIQKEIKNTSGQIDEVKKEITSKKKILKEIKQKIKTLQKVSLFVYMNGDIEAENFDIPEKEQTGCDKYFDDLLKNEVVEELSIKQIRQLAKLLVLLELLKEKELIWDITFESKVQQDVFEKLPYSIIEKM